MPDTQVRNLGVLFAASFFVAPHPVHQKSYRLYHQNRSGIQHIAGPQSLSCPHATISFVVLLGPALYQPPQSILNSGGQSFYNGSDHLTSCQKLHSGKNLGPHDDLQGWTKLASWPPWPHSLTCSHCSGHSGPLAFPQVC